MLNLNANSADIALLTDEELVLSINEANHYENQLAQWLINHKCSDSDWDTNLDDWKKCSSYIQRLMDEEYVRLETEDVKIRQ